MSNSFELSLKGKGDIAQKTFQVKDILLRWIGQCAESVLRGDGGFWTMVCIRQCSSTLRVTKKPLTRFSQQIQLSWLKVYQCYQETLLKPCSRSFCPRF